MYAVAKLPVGFTGIVSFVAVPWSAYTGACTQTAMLHVWLVASFPVFNKRQRYNRWGTKLGI